MINTIQLFRHQNREAYIIPATLHQGKKTPLQRIVEIITQTADPDRIILFGSRARRDNKKQSDYDICVIKRGVSRRRDLAMQIYRDLYGVGAAVDIIVETPDTYEELKGNPFLIYHDIARQWKVIYEKPVFSC
jgi:predicted nucleotidyltransferase